jgi:hypothetical protein
MWLRYMCDGCPYVFDMFAVGGAIKVSIQFMVGAITIPILIVGTIMVLNIGLGTLRMVFDMLVMGSAIKVPPPQRHKETKGLPGPSQSRHLPQRNAGPSRDPTGRTQKSRQKVGR